MVDYEFDINVQKKERTSFLYSISKEELKPLIFSETSETRIGKYSGNFTVNMKTTKFQNQECILVHVNMHVQTWNGEVTTFVSSYLNFHLESLEYQQYDHVQKGKENHHKIVIVHRDGNEFLIKKSVIANKNVSRSEFHYSTKELNGFVTEASNVLLLRVLAKRKTKSELRFSTLCEDCTPSTLIYRPLEPEFCSSGDEMSPVYGIEYSIVPETGNISVWRKYLTADYKLAYGNNSCCYPLVSLKACDSMKPNFDKDFSTCQRVFGNSRTFIEALNSEEVILALFDEYFKIKNQDGKVIGDVKIDIELDQGLIILHANVDVQIGDKVGQISMTGRVTYGLDTVHQRMELKFEKNKELFFSEETIISLTDNSSYVVDRTSTTKSDVYKKSYIIEKRNDLPFISETAAIILQRLIVCKQVDELFEFKSFHLNYLECTLKYLPLHSYFHSINGQWSDVYGLQLVVENSNCQTQRWSFRYTKSGHCIECIDNDIQEMRLHSPAFIWDFEPLPIHSFPDSISNGSYFSMVIDPSELKYILFTDTLSMADSEKYGVMKNDWQYSASTVFVKYRNADAILVNVNCFMFVGSAIAQSSIAAYIDLNLKIINSKQVTYMEADGAVSEVVTTCLSDDKVYNIHCWTADETTLSVRSQKFLKSEHYVCEASCVLIHRLMVLRNTQTNLSFTNIDGFGNAKEILLIPKEHSIIEIEKESFMGFNIDIVLLNGFGNTERHHSHFIQSGILLSSTESRTGRKMENTSVHIVKRREEPTYLERKSLKLELLPNIISKSSCEALHSIKLDEIEDLLMQDELSVFSQNNEEVGKYCFVSKTMNYEGRHCISLQLDFSNRLQNSEMKTSVTDMLTLDLHVLKSRRINRVEDFSTKMESEVALYLEKTESGFLGKHNFQEYVDDEFDVMVIKNSAFVTEPLCLFFQKLIVLRKLKGSYTFSSIDRWDNPCKVVLRSLGIKEKTINGKIIETYVFEVDQIPLQKCCRTSRNYFSLSGYYLFCERVGLPMKMTIVNFPNEDQLMEHNSSFFSNYRQFCESLELGDFDNVLFPDYAHVVTEERLHIGEYYATVKCIKYNGKNCFYVYNFLNANSSGRKCSTMVHTVVTHDLKTIKFDKHQIVEAEEYTIETKMSMELNGDIYVLDTVCTFNGEIIKEYTVDIPKEQLQQFCCEGVALLVMRLMVTRKIEKSLKFVSLDEDLEMCETEFSSLEKRKINVSGCSVDAWRIDNTTFFKNGKIMTWQYNFAEEGNLLTRKQTDIPVLIIVPSVISKKYQDVSENRSGHSLDLKVIIGETQKQPEILNTFNNYLEYLLGNSRR